MLSSFCNVRACILLTPLVLTSCAGQQAGPTPPPPPPLPVALAPEPPEALEAETASGEPLYCPNNLPNVTVASIHSKRGAAMVFSTESIPNRDELHARANALVDMYNQVYGSEGERTSWARAERSADGVRVDFAIFTPPDIDERVEPVPETSEAELDALKTRVEEYVVRMQAGDPCPLMRSLEREGARVPPYLAHQE